MLTLHLLYMADTHRLLQGEDGAGMTTYLEERVEGVVVDVRRTYIRVAVRSRESDRFIEVGPSGTWRIDSHNPPTTINRQLTVRKAGS